MAQFSIPRPDRSSPDLVGEIVGADGRYRGMVGWKSGRSGGDSEAEARALLRGAVVHLYTREIREAIGRISMCNGMIDGGIDEILRPWGSR